MGAALVFAAGIFAGYLIKPAPAAAPAVFSSDAAAWAAAGGRLKADLAAGGEYDCCLLKPCSYCLYEEGECECRRDILEGRPPCGECIGEILEGKGLPELKPFFAKAIAGELGAESEGHLREIINSAYPEK